MSSEAPVVLIIFNRPKLTKRVLERLALVKPAKLFVIADGPRTHKAEDASLCRECRDLIAAIDWTCDIQTNYSDVNLGCGKRIATGLSWVFENVDRAIILEDDCLPSETFFPYCNEMLERYDQDPRVMMVSGNNFVSESHSMQNDYTFFRCLNLWGWATWSRTWDHFDFTLRRWPFHRRTFLLSRLFEHPPIRSFWKSKFDKYYLLPEREDVWDYHFTFAVLSARGMGIAPKQNLVSNIGFGPEATHTLGENPLANLATKDLQFPICHPIEVAYDKDYDQAVFDAVFRTKEENSKRRRKLARLRHMLLNLLPLELHRRFFLG